MYRFAEGLKLLLEFGADCSVQDENGDTCLHLCFTYNHFEGLQVLVKYAASQRVRQHLLEGGAGEKGDASSKQPRSAIRLAVEDELAKFEDITNKKGWRALDYASTFELAARYTSSKDTWIDQAIDEEMALQNAVDTDSALSLHLYEQLYERSAKMSSMNSLNSSSMNVDAPALSLSNSSLVGNDLGVLLSPIQLIMQPYLASSRHGSFYDGYTDVSPGITTNSSKPSTPTGTENKTRQHSRSLPGPAPEPPLERPPQTRKRSNTSQAFGHRPPPLQVIRTPTLGLGPLQPPHTPVAVEALKSDHSVTPSLKSVTISPLVRHSKRRSSDDVTPDLKIDPKLALMQNYNGNSSSSSINGTSPSSVVTPTSTRTTFSFSPLKFSRRRSASTSNAPRSESSVAARAAAEAAVRSKGSLIRMHPLGPEKLPVRLYLPLKRNASTPIINTHFDSLETLSRRASRRKSIADVNKGQSLHKIPVLESPSTESSLDTIDLSTMLIGESEHRHRFTISIPEAAASEVESRSKRSPGHKLSNPLEDLQKHLKVSAGFTQPPSLVSPLASQLPTSSQHSVQLSSSPDARTPGGTKGIVRNVSSISFTRVRDE